MLSVVAFHAFPQWVRGGFIGVDVFFVISGFLISGIIFGGLDGGAFSFAEFYARRVRRIFPALLLVLVASAAYGWFALLGDEYRQLGKHVAGGAGFLSNFVLWGEAGYFDNGAETKPLLHLWSLGIEEQFYILWPFLLWLAWRGHFGFFAVTLAIALTSFGWNAILIGHDKVATFYSPLTRFWELMCGGLLAWAGAHHPAMPRRSADLASITGLGFLIAGICVIGPDDRFPGLWAVIPVAGAVLVIAAGPQGWANRRLLSNRVAIWFGLISFPLYLWHWPLLSFTAIARPGTVELRHRVWAVAIAVLLAWLTYRYVERHVRFAKGRVPVVGILCLLMVVVGALGYQVSRADGYPDRLAGSGAKAIRHHKVGLASQERQEAIRSGICHFNQRGRAVEIDDFIPQWRCRSSEEGLIDSRILVFGDSHAADIAMALRLNGLGVMQVGGAGCELTPRFVAPERDYCRKLIHLVEANSESFDALILANLFPAASLSQPYLDDILRFWGATGKPVMLLAPMPDFERQSQEYVQTGLPVTPPDRTDEDRFLSILQRLEVPASFTVVKTSELWCGDDAGSGRAPCAFTVQDRLLMVDRGHLSVEGARILGRRLVADPRFDRLLHPPTTGTQQ